MYALRNFYLTIKLIFYIININNYNLLTNYFKYVLFQSLIFDLINIIVRINYTRYYTILLYIISMFFDSSFLFLIIFISLDLLLLNINYENPIFCSWCFQEITYKVKKEKCKHLYHTECKQYLKCNICSINNI